MKFQQIANIIENRIRSGAYAISAMPGERKIAAELGVSHMTARKAVQHLIEQGVLPRRSAGRAAVAESRLRPDAKLSIAFVGSESSIQARWLMALQRVIKPLHGAVRSIYYVGGHDPVIIDALDGKFDGIFLIPSPDMPEVLLNRFQRDRHRMVTLFEDLTHLGIPCVDFASPRFIWRLAEHLASLGHRRVDCFNTQPHNRLIQQRISAWKTAAEQHGIETRLRDHAVAPFEEPEIQAHKVSRAFLVEPDFDATALFCVTAGAVCGLMRAAHELGITIGPDLSVCTCDALEECRLMVPSITTLKNPDREPLVRLGVEWIRTHGKGWNRPLQIWPDDVPVWVGESTLPARTGPLQVRTSGLNTKQHTLLAKS